MEKVKLAIQIEGHRFFDDRKLRTLKPDCMLGVKIFFNPYDFTIAYRKQEMIMVIVFFSVFVVTLIFIDEMRSARGLDPQRKDFSACRLEKFSIMKKMKFAIAVVMALLIAVACKGDRSEWLWKIEGRTTTLADLDSAYSGFAVMIKGQMQQNLGYISDEKLKEMMDNPDSAPNPQLADVFKRFGKDAFADQYKDMILLNMDAQKEGFAKRADVKAKLEFLQKYYLAELYLFDQLKLGDLKISDAEAFVEWEKIKKQDPRYKTVPVDQGIEMVKSRMVMLTAVEKQKTVLKNITQKYRIENNKDFDIAAHVKKQREEFAKKKDAPATEQPKK